MISNKKLFLSALLFTYCQSVLPIKLTTARVTASLLSIGSGFAGYHLSKAGQYAPLIGGASGLAVGALSYWILYDFTPQGRFETARTMVGRILSNPFSTQTFMYDQDAYEAIKESYILDSFWLIAANNDFMFLIKKAHHSISLLDDAMAEMNDYAFLRDCKELKAYAKEAIENITPILKIIRAHPEYLTQLKAWEEKMAKERELAVQQQMAHAQQQQAWAQQQQAWAQQQQANSISHITLQ